MGARRRESSLFDRDADPALDELVELAAVLCGTDYAYLGWMDYNRLGTRHGSDSRPAIAAGYNGLPVDAGSGKAPAD